jgi:hypothetical protein
MKFEKLKFEKVYDGVQARVSFRNGFEISVVKHSGSYGGEKGLYEIAVFDATGQLCDPLGWGDTVKGWLEPEDVESYTHQIECV